MVQTVLSPSHVTLELKLDAPFPDVPTTAGRSTWQAERHLRTAFFDTVDYRLWDHGFLLRHQVDEGRPRGTWALDRVEGGDWTPLVSPGERDAVPPLVLETLLGVLRRAPLRPMGEISTRRRPLVLQDPVGVSVGEIDDDLVTLVTGPQRGRRLRWIDVALPASSEPDRERVIERLRRTGAQRIDRAAIGALLGLAHDHGRRGSLRRGSSAADLVRTTLKAGLDRLVDHDWRIRRRALDPDVEDVHQARVATRRLRSDLKTFRSLLDPVWVRHTRDELAWLGDALGRVRDVDVMAARFGDDEAAGAGAGIEGLLDRLGDERREATAALTVVMGDHRYLDLVERLHAGAGQPPFFGDTPTDRAAGDVVPHLVEDQWRRLRRRVSAATEPPLDTELHRIRIAAKQLRYAAEAATPVIGDPAGHTAAAAKHLQTVLGDHQDAVHAQAWLRRVASVDPPVAFEAGWLAAIQHREKAAVRARWRKALRPVAQKKSRHWMT